MLGLRKSFGSGVLSFSASSGASSDNPTEAGKKLRHRSSVSSSLNSDNNSIDEDSRPSPLRRDNIRASLKEPKSAMTVPPKSPGAPEVVTTDGSVDSSPDLEKTALTNGRVITNGSTVSKKQTLTSSFRTHRVTDIYRTIRRNIVQLDDYTYTEQYFQSLDIESYRKHIANERLIRMPRRGSNWDRALRAALMFGENLVEFGDEIQGFCPDTTEASVTGLASCKLLLEIDNNSHALVPTFQALRELAVLVNQVIQIDGLFESSEAVKHATADLYIDLIRLVGDIALFYKRKVDSLSNGSTTIKFDVEFGKHIKHIWEHKARIVHHMWEVKLGMEVNGVDVLRQKLQGNYSAHDSFYAQIKSNTHRAEDTCEWLKSYLVEFLAGDEKTFTITGPAGCGKTMLASWVRERLQRPLNDGEFFTLYYTFPFDSPEEATSLAFLKNILFQLMERSVGDVDLYKRLVATFTEYSKHGDKQKLEASLWAALDVGLRTLATHGHHVVIIVDALEEVTGTTPLAFHKTLREHAAKSDSARAITFSKHISHISQGCKHLLITQKYIVDDIRSFLRQFLGGVPAFTALTGVAEDRVLQELTEKAGTSFLWANLAANLLSKEVNSEAVLKTVQSLSSELHDAIDRILGKLQLKAGAARRIFSSLLVARRPLSVSEVTELLSVDLEKRAIANGPVSDVFHELPRLCGSLAVIRDARVHFKSKAVREHLLTMLGKSLPSANDAHSQLTRSLLLYVKLNLDMVYEPSFDELGYAAAGEYFSAKPLLQYAVENWLLHFRSSGMCESDGKVTLTTEVKEVFPDSALVPLLERSCWGSDSVDLRKRYETALMIREACFADKGISVLQTLIILGTICQGHSHAEGAARYFYRAANVSQLVLSRSHNITMVCSSRFLQITDTMTFTHRTEIVTWRIRVIEFMIEETKRTKGPHSHAVIRWYELLATLYVSIGEHHNAAMTRKLIYEIYVFLEGKESHGARKIAESFGGLDITLKDEGDHRHIKEIQKVLLESDEGDGAEASSVEIRLKLALVYKAQKQWILAEEIFIALWRSISIACRLKASWELHIAKLRVAIEYVTFLRELERTEEAVSILTILWAEYEHHVCEDLTMVLRLKEIALLFRAFGLLDVSVAILWKVWGWFKSKDKVTHNDALETTVLVTQIVEEITTTTTKTKTTTITTTETTEVLVKEIYKTHYHRCKTSGRSDEAFFRSCFALINLYQRLENWLQAEIITRETLEITWKAILAAEDNIKIKLCESHVTECIRLATSYAICFHRMRRFEEAERIYLRIFRACIDSLDLDHECVKSSIAALIAFYEEHHRHDKVIEIYVGILERYRKHFGPGHARTIEILYLLAAQCRILGRKDEYTYYIEIVTVLNKGSKHCHRDARSAAVLLIEYYYEHKQWAELQHICALLWETFLHDHHECPFAEHEIELIYRRYLYVLEVHAKVEFTVLYRLAKEYHTHVLVVFGAAAAIVIKAMVAFAGICERHHEHHHEAVTVYEEVIRKVTSTKTTTVTISETEISTVKTRLSKIYVTIITSGGKTSTTTFERAIQLCLELYARFKLEYGCWHETTLGKLREIVLIYHKMGGQEYRTKMIEILDAAFVSIVSASVSSVKLYAAATTLAAIYVTAGLVEHADKLVQEVLHLILFGKAFDEKNIALPADVKLSKLAFVFLTAFKQRLVRESIWTYSEVMASLLLEMSLYEQYTQAVNTNSKIEVILAHGAKLRSFWAEAKLVRHEHLITALDQQLFFLFKTGFKASLRGDEAVIREFYVALVVELGRASRSRSKTDFAALACKAGNARVAQLLESGEFRRAHEMARCAFRFASQQRFYHDLYRVHYGYRLAEYMAGVDVRSRPSDAKLAEDMLGASREILGHVLEVFKEDGVDFVHLNFKDLAGIVRLLGSQGNYAQLEQILRTLWSTREMHSWPSSRILSVGRLLVHVYHANGKLGPAIEMCDRLVYNLQRSKGYLHPDALDMSRLLASLYSSGLPSDPKTRRPDKAMDVYETVLRQIDLACSSASSSSSAAAPATPPRTNGSQGGGGGGGGASRRRSLGHKAAVGAETNPQVLAAAASLQFELLKRAYARCGSWPKPVKEFADLHARLVERLGKDNLAVPSPEVWKAGEKESKDGLGVYVPPKEWRLESGETEAVNGGGKANGTRTGWVCGVGPSGTMVASVKG